jgi:hypothetical protein
LTDTIETRLQISAAVRGPSGSPVGDQAVVFTSVSALVGVARLQTGADESSVLVRTESSGAAAAFIVLRQVSGEGYVRVTLPGTTVVDSVRVTVAPGKPRSVRAMPRDTALYAGAVIPVSVAVRDRFDNVTGIPVTWTNVRPQIAAVNQQAQSLSALATGRAWIRASVDTLVDSIAVSVVPRGELAARPYIFTSDGIHRLHLFQLDGSNYRTVSMAGYSANTSSLRWLPDGARLIFSSVEPGSVVNLWATLYTYHVDNGFSEFTPLVPQSNMAQPTPDESGWIYFTRTFPFQRAEIWRIRLDGTDMERAGPEAADDERELQPAPNADGSFIALLSNRGLSSGLTLRILDRSTGSLQSLGLEARRPRWSPDYSEIAFLRDSRLEVIKPDGSGLEVLIEASAFLDDAQGQLDWSPDGKWILTCAYGFAHGYTGSRVVVLINRQSGELLPLAFTAPADLCEAAWRPE